MDKSQDARPDPVYHDPFHKPRKASRLSRLRYRLWQWVEAGAAKHMEADRVFDAANEAIHAPWKGMIVPDSIKVYDHALSVEEVVDEIVTEGERRRASEALRLRRLMLAVALAMAGCGGAVAAWVVWGG